MTIKQGIRYLSLIKNQSEPVFILRGQDPLADAVICFWAREALAIAVSLKKVLGAERVARLCQEWPVKKIPD